MLIEALCGPLYRTQISQNSQLKTGWLVYALELVYLNDQLDFRARAVLHVSIELILTPLLDYHIGA